MIDRNANMAECSLSFFIFEDFNSRNSRAGREHLIFHFKMSFEGPSAEKGGGKSSPKTQAETYLNLNLNLNLRPRMTFGNVCTASAETHTCAQFCKSGPNFGLPPLPLPSSLPPPLLMAITHLGPRIKILSQSSKLFITQFPLFELLKQHFLPALPHSVPVPKPCPTAPARRGAEQLHPVRLGWGSSTFPVPSSWQCPEGCHPCLSHAPGHAVPLLLAHPAAP